MNKVLKPLARFKMLHLPTELVFCFVYWQKDSSFHLLLSVNLSIFDSLIIFSVCLSDCYFRICFLVQRRIYLYRAKASNSCSTSGREKSCLLDL